MTDSHHPDADQIKADLLQIISEIVGETLPPIPDETPILDFVLSSLTLVEGMRRIYDHFGVLVSIRRVIEGQVTLGGIAAYIEQEMHEQRRRSPGGDAPVVLEADSETRRVPLSPSQVNIGVLFHYSREASAAYNEYIAVRLSGSLDGPALDAAVDAVVARYEALRTSMAADLNELHVHAPRSIGLRAVPIPEVQLQGRLKELAARPFAPGDRLFRIELMRDPKGMHYLILVSHAIVMDPEALRLVLDEIAVFYNAYTRDAEPDSLFPAIQWTDYLAMGDAEVMQHVRQEDEAYWVDRLADPAPHLELPTDHVRPPVKQYAGAVISQELDPGVVRKFGMDAQVLRDNLFAAFSLYLGRLSGQDSFAVGLRSNALYLDSAQRVVGQTRTMLPVRIHTDLERPFSDWVVVQHAAAAEADAHRNFSLAEMIAAANTPRDQSRSPLFTAAFSYETTPPLRGFDQLSVESIRIDGAFARYDIELSVQMDGGRVLLNCVYSTELFHRDTIARWLEGYQAMLIAGLQSPEMVCARLPLMSAERLEELLKGLNATEADLPQDRTVLDAILETAEKMPDAVAIRFEDSYVRYEELAARIEAIAGLLSARGVQRGDRVGVMLNHSPELIAVLLTV